MLDHYAFQLKVLDGAVREALRVQCLDQGSRFYGALVETGQGVTGPHASISLARRLIEGYCVPGGAFCGDEALLERAALAMAFALSLVHEDGTIDLVTTNFHDASETAFAVQTAAPALMLLREFGRGGAAEERLDALMRRFIDRAADGLLAGGFHTPNHRWVHAAALALCWKLTGREELLAKMRAFLAEGIDCDEAGEYTERSSGVYNIVCDRSFILLAETLGMEELLAHVERNLAMVEMYFEPDHTVNTLNSARQDAGTSPDWRIYYSCYLYMALRTGRRDFAWIADEMLRQSDYEPLYHERRPGGLYDFLYFLLRDPDTLARMAAIQGEEPPARFDRHFERSGIVRARRGDLTLTLVKDQPLFAMLRFGTHPIWLRLAGCFYAKGQFEPQSIEAAEDGWRLRFAVRWGYKGPLPEPQDTSDWRKMDHSRRPEVFMQDFGFEVTARLNDGKVSFDVVSFGQDGVPVKLELLTEPGGQFETGDLALRARPGDYLYLRRDAALYRWPDRHTMDIAGGFGSHLFGENMRGALPGDGERLFVCMTGETPLHQRVTLSFQ